MNLNIVKDNRYEKILSSTDLVLIGISLTIGSGFFIILNDIYKYSGKLLWLSMLLGGLFGLLTALSYAELSSIFNSNGAEHIYISTVFGRDIGNVISSIILLLGFLTVSLLTIGLTTYINDLSGLNINKKYLSIILTILFGFINLSGIENAITINRNVAKLKIIGLIIIIIYGILNMDDKTHISTNPKSVVIGGILSLFAFLSFNNIIALSEETKDTSKNISKSVLITVVVSAFIYVLLSFIYTGNLSSSDIINSKFSPYELLINKLFNGNLKYIFFSLIILSSIDVLIISHITESRHIHAYLSSLSKEFMHYDMSFKKVPYISAIIMASFVVITLLFIKNLDNIYKYIDIVVMLLFVLINVIVLIMRIKYPDIQRYFKIPYNINNMPISAILGSIIGIFSICVYLNK